MAEDNKEIWVAVSGGFDPVHVGHVRMFEEAKKLGDKLIVIINNDNWLTKKKGHVFMPQEERGEIIQNFSFVDRVVFTDHSEDSTDTTVCKELELYRPNIFANGGDRLADNTPEVEICKKIGCEMVFNIGEGGKIQSSSWLLDEFWENYKKNKK
ncbi:adenylyltransferase/cytidyltransferase family protein [Patescibacteria group bacterium]|nr:adenylyltransferase/cytidyltransferase family protein [Patescibacteria group bacterium]